MPKLLLKDGTALVSGKMEKCDILISDGVIEKIGTGIECPSAETVDCSGLTLLPGFVDMHVHLRQPGFEYKETVKTGSMAAAAGGFTAVCAMPNLNPVADSPEHIKQELNIIERDAVIDVLPYAAITLGEKGQELSDIEALAPLCVGFSDDGKGVQSGEMMKKAMERVKKAGSFIAAHCEDESLLEGGSVHKGEFASHMGIKGISSASEYVQVERDVELAGQTGVRYHVCHISAKESIEAVRRGKKKGYSVTCEVTPHHVALCDMDIKSDDGKYKMNPPLRGAEDREAIFEGLRDGTIDCIATDHAPHSKEEKSRGLEKSAFGIVGSETAFSVCYTELVKGGVITLERLSELMSANPARILGRESGIEEGKRADIAVIDLEKEYMVKGEEFLSMGKSTPFEGMRLQAQVEATVCGGKIVYRRK